MRVLVLGNDTPLGYSISAFANPLRRHELIGISIEKTRWGRERKVRRVVRDAAPDIVLDTRIVTQIDSSDRIGQRDVQRTAWLAEACERIGASYFYLSSAFVFSGQMTRPYLESDTPDVTSGLGRVLLDIEETLTSRLDDVLILRLGRLFAGRRPMHSAQRWMRCVAVKRCRFQTVFKEILFTSLRWLASVWVF